jgi:hypothetical protein
MKMTVAGIAIAIVRSASVMSLCADQNVTC